MSKSAKPTFFWQGVLILLPMLALTLVGLFSLWRDRVNSQREAQERAAREAAQLVDKISTQINSFPSYKTQASSSGHLLQIELFGELCRFCMTGTSASLFALNNPDKEALYRFNPAESWSSIPLDKPQEDPVFRLFSTDRKIRFCLLEKNGQLRYPPPLNLTPQPQALTDSDDQRLREEWQRRSSSTSDNDAAWFSEIANNHAEAVSESGVPLQVLARYKIASLFVSKTNSLAGKALIELTATAVLKPSAISAPVLDKVKFWAEQVSCTESERQAINGWIKVWTAHEKARELWRESRQKGKTNCVWLDQKPWAVCETYDALLVAQPVDQIQHDLCSAVQKSLDHDYFALNTTIAGAIPLSLRRIPLIEIPAPNGQNFVEMNTGSNTGKKLYLSPPLNGFEILPSLASVNLAFPGDGKSSLVKINCVLERPDLLYAGQKRRELIFALFIGVAAISAAAGFITARRAFYRQLQVSEMKSNFVSAVSHELRAPLASVRLMAESMNNGKITEPKKQREYFRFIVQECRRLTSLIENVLDFSRIEQGRKRYEFESTDLVALTQQTVNVMNPYAHERKVSINLELPQAPFPEPSCDGLAIQQALVNLLDNAIKHSPPGSSVTVGLSSSADAQACSPGFSPSSFVKLWVADQGPGIPKEEQQKIFERFYRRGTELRRETQGVGIGLTIVKHIMEAHKGRVEVDSEPDKGSRFTLILPIDREQSQNPFICRES